MPSLNCCIFNFNNFKLFHPSPAKLRKKLTNHNLLFKSIDFCSRFQRAWNKHKKLPFSANNFRPARWKTIFHQSAISIRCLGAVRGSNFPSLSLLGQTHAHSKTAVPSNAISCKTEAKANPSRRIIRPCQMRKERAHTAGCSGNSSHLLPIFLLPLFVSKQLESISTRGREFMQTPPPRLGRALNYHSQLSHQWV